MYKKSFLYTVLLLILINLGFVIYYYRLKTTYHVDEIFSYGHANSTQGAFLVKGIDANMHLEDLEKYLLNRWLDGSVFHNYLTVQPSENFHYKHIFENLAVGVHPPLFYILLHTICSFTPNVFSKWQGAALNIPIWIILLIMMYKLSRRFFEDKYMALLPVIFYAFSQIGFNTVLYIRGYLMQTLWAVCLAYEAVILLQEKQISKKHWFLIFLYSLLGMLTQYNSIIYSAIVGVVIGLGLLSQHRYKDIIILALTLVLSICALFIIFPEVIGVFTHTNRARTVSAIGKNLLNNISWIAYRIGEKKSSATYMTSLWSFHKVYGYALMEIIILVLFYKYVYTKSRRDIDLLAIIYIAMCIFAEIFMPQMFVYNMRYIMLVMPLIAIVTIWYLDFILKSFKFKDKISKIILGLIILINALFVDFSTRSPYAFSKNVYEMQNIEGKIVYMATEGIFFYENIDILGKASQVYLSYSNNSTKKMINEIDKADYVINFNTDSRYNLNTFVKEPAKIPQNLSENLKFIKTIKRGERFYDLYRIEHNQEKGLKQ